MDFERFKKIIEYNRNHQEEINRKVRELYSQAGMDYESDILNIMQVVRPLFEKKHYLVLEMPFKDKEIGAISYKGNSFGYTFLNSALPKVNVNFALCHEIYHIFFQQQTFDKKIELYMNEHYYEYEDELSANYFAGVLLMPKQSFMSMFRKFFAEKKAEDSNVSILVQLMNYFEVPYMAVLIRCYELDLLKQGEILKELLEVEAETISQLFSRLWLNEDILTPTNRDDYRILEYVVRINGEKMKEKELLNQRTLDKAIENMRKIYDEIRG